MYTRAILFCRVPPAMSSNNFPWGSRCDSARVIMVLVDTVSTCRNYDRLAWSCRRGSFRSWRWIATADKTTNERARLPILDRAAAVYRNGLVHFKNIITLLSVTFLSTKTVVVPRFHHHGLLSPQRNQRSYSIMSRLNNPSLNESSEAFVVNTHEKHQRHLYNPEITTTHNTNQSRRAESFSALTAITVPLTDDSSLSEEEEEEEFLSAAAAVETNPERIPNKVTIQRISSSIFPLTFGVLGVWISYICYGTLQEDLFTKSAFHHAWFLQVLESCVHCFLGFLLRQYTQKKNVPTDGDDGKYLVRYNVRNMMPFFQSGCSQVFAKAFVSMSLANGLSFAVCTLAKSAKLIPVLAGGILLGGATLSFRDCVFALFIVSGTAVLSMTKSSHSRNESSNHSTPIGLLFILASLTMDGVTAGLQKRLKRSTASQPPGVPEFLFFCSASMAVTALFIALCTGELREGIALLQMDTSIRRMVAVACLCSAVGQCFVFYIITRFDPVTLALVTTSRKLLSVIYSLSRQSNNNTLSGLGRFGLILAIIGILGDVQSKIVNQHNVSCRRQSQNKFSAAVWKIKEHICSISAWCYPVIIRAKEMNCYMPPKPDCRLRSFAILTSKMIFFALAKYIGWIFF